MIFSGDAPCISTMRSTFLELQGLSLLGFRFYRGFRVSQFGIEVLGCTPLGF